MRVKRDTMIIARVLGYLMLVMATAERFAANAESAEESWERTTSGTFVSFKNGALTIKAKSGLVVFKQVDANYKTYQDNDPGAGAKLVDTTLALSNVAPGMAMRVNVEDREIQFGLDYRVIGAFESYQDGKLIVQALEAPPGSVTKPTGTITLAVDRALPVLQSIDGGEYQPVTSDALKNLREGTTITIRKAEEIVIEVFIGVANKK